MTRRHFAELLPSEYDSAMATDRTVSAAAKKAARARARPKAPLKWSEAMAEAPVPRELPVAFEDTFRRAYAAELARLKMATPAAKAGRSGTRGYETKLHRRQVNATKAEFQEQDAAAAETGLSWSAWARRGLSDLAKK